MKDEIQNMNYLKTLLILPLLCSFLHADPLPSPVTGLVTPASSDGPRAKSMESIGFEWWHHHRGFEDREQMPHAEGYFTVIRPMKGFAQAGDVVWELRVILGPFALSGILWINERTHQVIALGVDLPKTSVPASN